MVRARVGRDARPRAGHFELRVFVVRLVRDEHPDLAPAVEKHYYRADPDHQDEHYDRDFDSSHLRTRTDDSDDVSRTKKPIVFDVTRILRGVRNSVPGTLGRFGATASSSVKKKTHECVCDIIMVSKLDNMKKRTVEKKNSCFVTIKQAGNQMLLKIA